MRIEGNHRAIRPVDNGDEAIRQGRLKGGGQVRRADAVEISDSAKQLHAEAAGKATGFHPSITTIRERSRSGFYDTDEVMRLVARRIIDLGDL